MNQKAKIGKYRWVIVVMLFLLFSINFVDKAILGLASNAIIKEYSLDPVQWGTISGSFFWLFSICALLGGFLTKRFKPSRLLNGLSISWAVLQISFMALGGFAYLLFNRIVLGALEAPTWLTIQKMLKEWLPGKEMARGVSLIHIGVFFGQATLAPVILYIIATYNWKFAFLFVGVLGAIWSIAWKFLAKDTPAESRFVGKEELDLIQQSKQDDTDDYKVPLRRILLSPAFLASVCVCVAGYYQVALVLTWMVRFAGDYYHMDEKSISIFLLLVTFFGIFSGAIGFVSDYLFRKTNSHWIARGVIASLGILFTGVFIMFATRAATPMMSAVYFGITTFFYGCAFNSATAMINENVPKSQIGQAQGINNAIFSATGVIAPLVTGIILKNTNSYQSAFDVSAYICFAAAVIAIIYMKSSKFNFTLKAASRDEVSSSFKG